MQAYNLGGKAGSLKRATMFGSLAIKYNYNMPSYIGSMAADFCCDKSDLQCFSCLITGALGSGKSLSALYLCIKTATEFAKRLGGEPIDYFDPSKHVLALGSGLDIVEFLNRTPPQRVVLLDDASTALGSRDFQSREAKSMGKILAVVRSKRWAMFYTVPLSRLLDVNVRLLTGNILTIKKSCHSDGFNILSGYRNLISPMGEFYKAKFKDNDGKKIEHFLAFRPDDEVVKAYNIIREKGATDLLSRENDKLQGNAVNKKEVASKSAKESRILLCMDILKDNPDIKRLELEIALGCSHDTASKTKIEALKRMGACCGN